MCPADVPFLHPILPHIIYALPNTSASLKTAHLQLLPGADSIFDTQKIGSIGTAIRKWNFTIKVNKMDVTAYLILPFKKGLINTATYSGTRK